MSPHTFTMTSSNGNIFRVNGPLCGEFTGHRWIPLPMPVTRRFDVFFDLRLNTRFSNNRDAGDLRRHRFPVNSPHKGQWRGALMFYLICVWINCWVNNREAGDLRRYRGHYDVTVMTDSLTAIRLGPCSSLAYPGDNNIAWDRWEPLWKQVLNGHVYRHLLDSGFLKTEHIDEYIDCMFFFIKYIEQGCYYLIWRISRNANTD